MVLSGVVVFLPQACMHGSPKIGVNVVQSHTTMVVMYLILKM